MAKRTTGKGATPSGAHDHTKDGEAGRNRLCLSPIETPRPLPVGIEAGRAAAIHLRGKLWVNQTVLHYYFMTDWAAPEHQKQVVRDAFNHWKLQGIGLTFTEVDRPGEAELRIGFQPNNESWSYEGTTNLQIESPKQTMNFGWRLANTGWGWATALHEIGHALGLPHEHQNPLSGIEWDEEAVYAEFEASQGWPRDKIQYNVLRKLQTSDVAGTEWDPTSIMHYPFRKGLIRRPPPWDKQAIGENTALSQNDIRLIRQTYPAPSVPEPTITAPAFRPLDIAAGQQLDFRFAPEDTRRYTVQTVGDVDTKLVVFEDRDGVPRYLQGDDDAGDDRNALIRVRMVRGRRYFIRVLLIHVHGSAAPGVLLN